MGKSAFWEAVGTNVDQTLAAYRTRTLPELAALIAENVEAKINVRGVHLQMTSWAANEVDGSIGVIVEARRKWPLGISQVHTRGFYKYADGRIVDMQDKDYWAHGY